MSCAHPICRRPHKGVGVVILDPSHGTVLLGKERFGRYKGRFNICAGSMEKEDGGCVVRAALRELMEEFKMTIGSAEWQRHFVRKDGSPRLVFLGTTPVVVGLFDSQALEDTYISTLMRHHVQVEGMQPTWQEMEEARWVSIQDVRPHAALPTSRFAQAVMRLPALRALDQMAAKRNYFVPVESNCTRGPSSPITCKPKVSLQA